VVPRREWGDAKTLVTEGVDEGKAAEVSTDNHISPWAKTNVEHPLPSLEDSTMPPPPAALSVEPGRGAHRRREPEDVGRSHPQPKKRPQSARTLPPIVVEAAGPGEQTDPAPVPTNSSRITLYIALLGAIIALLAGLIWLVSQR